VLLNAQATRSPWTWTGDCSKVTWVRLRTSGEVLAVTIRSMSIGQLYADAAPTLSLIVSGAAVWYARDKAVREAQALPLQEAYTGLLEIKNLYDPLYSLIGLDNVPLLEFHTQKDRYPSIPQMPDEMDPAIAKLRASKQQLTSPSEQRMDTVITSIEALKSAWVTVNNATSRDFEGQTAQTLGWNFGALQRALDTCRDKVEKYLNVVSDVNKRTLLRRWYYKRHWRATQWLLDIRIHRVVNDGLGV
jgi:hypothetical protein